MPLIYGSPVRELVEAAEAGEVVLAGCALPSDPPNCACPNGHRWPDESARGAHLTAVRRALRSRGADF